MPLRYKIQSLHFVTLCSQRRSRTACTFSLGGAKSSSQIWYIYSHSVPPRYKIQKPTLSHSVPPSIGQINVHYNMRPGKRSQFYTNLQSPILPLSKCALHGKSMPTWPRQYLIIQQKKYILKGTEKKVKVPCPKHLHDPQLIIKPANQDSFILSRE